MKRIPIIRFSWSFLICLMIFSACTPEKNNFSFLFIGHAYDWTQLEGNKVDSRIEKIDRSLFDGFWLGGDICANTSLDPKTWNYLDRLFNLSSRTSHFVLGNHDVRDNNLDAYYSLTGRPDYYTSTFHNIVVSVINTNLNSSNCEKLNAQYNMLKSVCDTLQVSSHYILMMHHQIFDSIDGIESLVSNGICKYYSMNCDAYDSYFSKTIYPSLVNLEKRGIEVIVLVGDSGWHKGSEEVCLNGVTFLTSGINNSHFIGKELRPEQLDEDKVLRFDLDVKARALSWDFVSLNKLSNTNRDEWLVAK